ncbi:hypothetical protein [Ruminococcus flavefaciens]|uniref:Uncharacterized protein n=1 Tax=Ruminococcus flavefaciens TaxID=1265 RepID=A0A1K1NBF9_RUMFL|nr:hypothetical protein [Ruminococcus flavefaciens]SFW32683.1 hypothetical protein SAMN02910280_1794 [Ruminococcus flavefaciens]
MRDLDPVEKVLDGWNVDYEARYYIMQAVEKVVKADDYEQAVKIAAPIIEKSEEQIRLDTTREVNQNYLITKGVEITGLSPFITETIQDNGKELNRTNFIPYVTYNDPGSEDVKMLFNDINGSWFVRINNGPNKLVSRFVVEACLIVDASESGSCRALVVFLKGSTKPLIFWGGIITSTDLRKQTQFQKKGLAMRNRDFYHESFLRALSMCHNVFFLTLPSHAGWNNTPDGKRVFVSAENMIPILSDLFYDVKE